MRAFSVVFVVGLLVGCGGAGGSGASDEPASAAGAGESAGSGSEKPGCELLTDAEVGEATASTIEGHEESGLDGCRWRAQGGMQLMFDVYAGSSVVPATCDAQKYLGTGREEDVPGLGDSALWKTSGSLVVCSARAVIRFNLDNSRRSPDDDKEALIALARSVLGRL